MRKISAFFMIIAISVYSGFSQEVSQKKEIAVFKLGYTSWDVPGDALGSVDQAIQRVFINLGRFDVIGMSYRLKARDVNAFIAKIKEVKSENVKIPEGVRLGEETFTEADFNALTGSFIIVVPVMTYYDEKMDNSGSYAVEIETSFTLINVAEGKAMAAFKINTTGTDDSMEKAVRNAVDDIPLQLSFQIRSIPEFQLKTGVIDVMGSDIVLELGNNMGVKKGDEFHLVSPLILPSGRTIERNTGLLIVKEVNEDVSIARAFYAKKKPSVGDQLKEVPRMGVETSFYADYILSDVPVVTMGTRAAVSRGFYSIRPIAGVEVPLGANNDFGVFFPVNAYAGTEINWYLGRLHITPSADVALGMLVPIVKDYGEYVVFTSIGGHARLSASFMINDDMKLFAEGGYTAMMSINALFDSYSGFFAGGGVTFKF